KGGPAALRAMVRQLRQGESVGITPDGPNGPAMRASAGIVGVARLAGVPILPMTYATSRRRILQTWDRFHLPLPFSRGVFLSGGACGGDGSAPRAAGARARRGARGRTVAGAPTPRPAEAGRGVGGGAGARGRLAGHAWRARRRAARGGG